MYKKFMYDLKRKRTDIEILEVQISAEEDDEKKKKLISDRDNLIESLNYREKLNYGI